MDDDDGWDLLLPRKRIKTTSFEKCIFCQTSNNLRHAQPSSIEKLILAFEVRQDEIAQRLSSDDLRHTLREGRNVKWHSSCYESYTSKQNLRYCSRVDSSEVQAGREQRASFDWSKCFFCKNASRKKDKQLINVATFEACQNIKESAEAREDNQLLFTLQSVNFDLIAAEGKYHKACHASYISKVNITRKQHDVQKESTFDEAFNQLCLAVTPEFERGKAFDMNALLLMFQIELKKMHLNADSYTKHKLKDRLIKYYKDRIVFLQPPHQSKPEIVYSSSISLVDVINAASHCSPVYTVNWTANKTDSCNFDLPGIYSVASDIRSEIMDCKGIEINPLNIEDLQLETAKALIPQSLYWLIRWIITGEQYNECSSLSASNTADERKILMFAQDLIHCASHARIKLPKHVGLAMTVKHLTSSKLLITILNRMGHSSSYSEIEQVETSLANESLAQADAKGVIIPTNINPGGFIQIAADNNDINEETLDGKNTTHATTLALYQRKQYGPMPARVLQASHTNRKRSLDSTRPLVIVEDINAGGRRPAFSDYKGNSDITTWFQCDSLLLPTCFDDLCWMLLRLSDSFLPCTPQNPQAQSVPGWSGFNSITHPNIPVESIIGYHPMINAEASNFSTLYTLLKLAQKINDAMGQVDSVVTFDLALYAKAKLLQMKYPDEFKNTVIRMGGFHIALNYLSLLGKKYAQSGLEDLLIESGVYAAGTTSVLMLGKSYNRGIRAHKLCMEALFRLLWRAFLLWLSKQENGLEPQVKQQLLDKSKKCQSTIRENGFVTESLPALKSCVEPIVTLFDSFKSESEKKSKVFCFWKDYIDMVLVLLQFIKAERTGNWKLHLSATASMVAHFFSMDRVNYARWLPVYISDMHSLQDNHPEVHREFSSGNFGVSRAKQPFAQVWTDMALEQSINRDSKSKGGIVGISTKENAVERWFLTSHERAAMVRAVKEMCGIGDSDEVGTHKEAKTARMVRDEDDVQKLLGIFERGLLSDPFNIPQETSEEELPLPLCNLATGVVLPNTDADKLINAKESGKESMISFVSSRMKTTEINFWDPITTLKIKSFRSLSKNVAIKNLKEKSFTINADRELFGRLLVAAKSRNINLKEVLSYELCSVPIALAHPDGSLRKTTKSTLMHILEKEVTSKINLPVSQIPTVYLIDGMALVQMLKSGGCATFDEMSLKYQDIILNALLHNNTTRVDLVFDQYLPASIKDGERSRRGESASLEVKIHSGSMPVPKQWSKYISNPKNKVNLCDFLCHSLCEKLPSRLQPTHKVFLAGGFRDGSVTVSLMQSSVTVEQSLQSDHEEADTRLMVHAKQASISHPRIVIQSPDTDVVVLSAAHFADIQCQEMWIKTGVKDKLRFIPVHDIHSSFGQNLCMCLPSFHALTGCDSTSAFSGIGKKKAWKALQKEVNTQLDLSTLGSNPVLQVPVKDIAESFICSMYSAKHFNNADEARYHLFCQKSLKSEDLPPTSESLSHHIKRANYQASVWKKALSPMQNIPPPEGNGWMMIDSNLVPVLMEKNPAPSEITELTKCGCGISQCKQNNCSCRRNNLPCTEACSCMADEVCSNQVNDVMLSDSDSSDSEDTEEL